MKNNLKNRPQKHEVGAHGLGEYDTLDVDEWFEGFENELREILRNRDRHFVDKQTIREILGDVDDE